MKKIINILKSILNKIFKKIFMLLIYFYKYIISPHTRRSCRYIPSCSD
ncbi:MAG: membrane protein insertion efficiency factor YidD, partial [Mycoplasmatales bacterium]